MIWNIVTDSSSDISQLNERRGDTEIRFASVPFIISVEGKDFIDDEALDISEMLNAMECSREASHTSCPTPQSWEDAFRREGNVIAITISKELSGSYNSACVARDMVLETDPDKKITIINSASTGPGIICLIRMLTREILAGRDFDAVSAMAHAQAEKQRTVFALCSFDNLVKNGRMSKIAGFIARTLGFWGIGVANEGKIAIKGKERSTRKVVASFTDDALVGFAPKYVAINHCENTEMAERIRAAICEKWPGIEVELFQTKGLCSYYAERHGLIVCYM